MDPSKLFRENIVSADGRLNYCENISLRNIALVNVVRILWMNEKHRFVEGYDLAPFLRGNKEWKDIENTVLTNIKQLPLPQFFLRQSANLTKFIGQELIMWIDFQTTKVFDAGQRVGCTSNKCDIAKIFINRVCQIKWTHSGKIDTGKTALVLLDDLNLEEEQKYVLLCIYCLEEELKKVSPQLINKYLDAFVSQKLNFHDFPMVYYWTYNLTNRPTNLYDLIHNSDMRVEEYVLNKISYWVINKYDVAKKYLWEKLTDSEKSERIFVLLFIDFPTLKYSLISALNYEQQKRIFQSTFSVYFLMSMFTDWQFVDCFLPTVYHIFEILNPSQLKF